MILSTQPIIRLVLLILIFIKSAFLFLLLDFYFLGLTYIIVYVGAIAILFLFVIMMAETHITPLKSIKNEFTIANNYSLKIKNSNNKNSQKLRIPLFNSISSADWISINNSNFTKGLDSNNNTNFFYILIFFSFLLILHQIDDIYYFLSNLPSLIYRLEIWIEILKIIIDIPYINNDIIVFADIWYFYFL